MSFHIRTPLIAAAGRRRRRLVLGNGRRLRRGRWSRTGGRGAEEGDKAAADEDNEEIAGHLDELDEDREAAGEGSTTAGKRALVLGSPGGQKLRPSLGIPRSLLVTEVHLQNVSLIPRIVQRTLRV